MDTKEDLQELEIALANTEIDADGWALIAPFGEHPKTRLAKGVDGMIVRQEFIQVLDNAAASDLMRAENSFFRRLRRAIVGIPVFRSHPDLATHSPETVTTDQGKPVPIGVLDNIRQSDRGIEAHFTLTPDGAAAVENEGYKHPSILWQVKPIETLANGTIRVRPFKIISVGLTPYPNIDGVEALTNEREKPAVSQEPKGPDMKLIAGWLLAQGIALANTEAPTESQILESLQKLHSTRSGEVIALGNEKTTLAGRITALEAEKTTLAGQVTTLGNEKGTLTTRVTTLENEFKAERKARAEVFTDLVITQGRVDVADRDTTITALANAADFAVEAKRLGELPVKFKVASTTDGRSKDSAGQQRTAHEQIISLANSDPRYKDIQDFTQAYNQILADHPTLKEQLNAGRTQ
jgi:hypothetical protein